MRIKVIILIILATFIPVISADYSNDSWGYYSTVTLDTNTPEANFQIVLSSDDYTIPAAMWANMSQDGNDTRILSTDFQTEYGFFIETMNSASDYEIWVNVTGSGTGSLIWAFNNSGASSQSSGNDTYILFDDFSGGTLDTDKWNTSLSVNNPFIDNGRLKFPDNEAAGNEWLFSKKTDIPNDIVMEVDVEYENEVNSRRYPRFLWTFDGVDDQNIMYYYGGKGGDNAGMGRGKKYVASSGTEVWVVNNVAWVDPTMHWEIKCSSDNHVWFYVDGTLRANNIDMDADTLTGGSVGFHEQGEIDSWWDNFNVRHYSTTNPVISSISAPISTTPDTDTTFTITLPVGYTYPKFEPTLSTSTQVQPNGQTSGQPFFNITNTGNVDLDIKMKLNGTITGVTLKADDDNTYAGSTTIGTSLVTIYSSLTSSSSVEVWFWSDFDHAAPQNTNKTLEVNVTES